jgi:peptidoglycan/xylan/chitin deacetylase (PgdA/CDA1 family)
VKIAASKKQQNRPLKCMRTFNLEGVRMISIHYNTDDIYTIYAIEHFIKRYKISAELNNSKLENGYIKIEFQGSDNKKFVLKIQENAIQEEIQGWVKTKDEQIPLFEKPLELNPIGSILAMFHLNAKEKYPCITLNGNFINFGFDIFKEIGYILSGHLERIWSSNKNEKSTIAKIPIVDCYEKILFDCILLASDKLNVPLKYETFWPDGKKFAVCLTHDVDRVKKTFQYVTHTIRHLKNEKIRLVLAQLSFLLKIENPYWNFDRIMEIERKLGVKSTFFFLNEQRIASLFSPSEWKLYLGRYDIKDSKIVKTIKRLDAEGWEIGIHGSYNSYNNLKRLEEEKKVLEELLGEKVHGISQHYLNLNSSETWTYHEKLGLVYDTSVGFVDEIGFRRGTCYPYSPFDPTENRTLSLWELPITIMDSVFFFDKRDFRKEYINVLEKVEKYGGVLLLRWHQRFFNEKEFPGMSDMYKKIIKISKEKNAWITNAYNIVEWLTQRERL